MTRLAWTATEGASAFTPAAAPAVDREEAVWRLYRERHADMVRFATFLTGDVHKGEDVAHEAFVRLVDAWGRLDDPDRAEAYLRTTIVNLVRGDHRRRMVAERHDHGGDIAVRSAEDVAMGRVGREQLLAAVASLPVRQRACVVMRHWMQMTESEIARDLDLSVGSVRTHVKRGTESLRKIFGAR
jgi:RNA polymerase sigma-70 factor (sigma-E family)